MDEQRDSDTVTASTLAAIDRFHEAFNRHDVTALLALLTEDFVFESTNPPDGTRYEGLTAARATFEEFFRASPHARFEIEEMFAAADRAIVRWRYEWTDADGHSGHVRGVDIMRVRDGRVAESLAYVKG